MNRWRSDAAGRRCTRTIFDFMLKIIAIALFGFGQQFQEGFPMFRLQHLRDPLGLVDIESITFSLGSLYNAREQNLEPVPLFGGLGWALVLQVAELTIDPCAAAAGGIEFARLAATFIVEFGTQ